MGDIVSELAAEDFVARRAAQRTAREHADLVALAAARTAAHGFALLERSRARQARAMKPWLLPVGALVRVSYLHAPTARQQLKSQLVRAMSPSYTLEVYRITARRLAPTARALCCTNACVLTTLPKATRARQSLATTACSFRWSSRTSTDAT